SVAGSAFEIATPEMLLRADLIGTRERGVECSLEPVVAWELAPNVANDPAEPDAQNPQLSMMAVELFCMRIAPCHHRGALGDAQIRMPQPHAVLLGQPGKPLDRRVQQLRIGREGDVLGLHSR